MGQPGHAQVGHGDEVLDVAESPGSGFRLLQKTIHRFDVGVTTPIEHMPRTTPPRCAFNVAARRLNGSSRERRAQLIHFVSALARVELNPGDVPRRLQAEGGGEKSFDLVVHEISGQQLGRRVISPTVMFAVESNSTGNGIEPLIFAAVPWLGHGCDGFPY